MNQPIKNKYVVGQEYYEVTGWDGEQTVHVFIYQGIVYSKGQQLHQFREARFAADAVPEEGLRHYAVRDVLEGPLTSLELRKANLSRQLNSEKRKRQSAALVDEQDAVSNSVERVRCAFPESPQITCRQDLEPLVDQEKPVYLYFYYEPTIDDLELVAQISPYVGMGFEYGMAPKHTGTLTPLSGKENLKSLWITQFPEPESTFLEMLKTFTGLQVLNLYYARISDQLGSSFKELKDLMELDLTKTRITDGIKYDLAGLTELTRLNLDRTRITDEFFLVDNLWAQLEILSLNATRITDQGVALLRGLAGLRDLELDGTDITDAAIPYLLQMPQLKCLSVEKTAITVRGARELMEGMKHCQVWC
jgi:Leucine-rich repeat (LRR) protein